MTMNKNIFKAHLEELLRQLTNKQVYENKEQKSTLLLGIEVQIEMCNLVKRQFNRDYSREKAIFSKVQEFVLLDDFVQAIDFIKLKLIEIDKNESSELDEYI